MSDSGLEYVADLGGLAMAAAFAVFMYNGVRTESAPETSSTKMKMSMATLLFAVGAGTALVANKLRK